MRRKVATLTLITIILITAAGLSLVSLTVANPYIEGYFPLESATTRPSISFQSPIQNRDYTLGDAWLNFTITKPETWFVPNVAYTENNESMTLAIGRITRVYYILDKGPPQNITVKDGDLPSAFSVEVFPTRVFNFSVRLILTGGLHSVKIGYEADTYYYTGWDVTDPGLRSVDVEGFSAEINFRIGEPLQTEIVVVASVAAAVAVSASLVLLYRKRRRQAALT